MPLDLHSLPSLAKARGLRPRLCTASVTPRRFYSAADRPPASGTVASPAPPPARLPVHTSTGMHNDLVHFAWPSLLGLGSGRRPGFFLGLLPGQMPAEAPIYQMAGGTA